MNKKVFRLYWDKDKEETWLNDMVSEGWALSHFFLGVYTFKKCEKGEYTYRIDFMNDVESSQRSRDYIKFVEDTGAEYVDSWFRWVFFRKKTSEGEFVLYTDIDSKIKNYKSIRNMFAVVSMLEFVIFINLIFSFFEHEEFYTSSLFFIGLIFMLFAILASAAIKTNIKINKLVKEKAIKE
jgi:hypothetical protein